MFPAVLFLYFLAAKKRKWVSIAVAVIVMLVGTYAVLAVSGYPPHVVKEIFFKEGGTHIVPFKPSNGWHAYTLFSPLYFSERANYYLLLGPFALLIFVIVVPYSLKYLSLSQSSWIFLVFMALFSIAFTCGINFDIGMARDWDLLSPYNIALVVAAAFAWFRYVGDVPMRKKLMIVMVSVTLIHTTAYILVNAQDEPSVERFKTLRDPRVWGPAALIYADEGLGTYYRREGDNQKALFYYQEGLNIDSLNARRWLAIASVYQALGQKENFDRALEKAVETGTPDIQVHLRLGEDYIREGNIDKAIAIWKKGLSTGPNAVGLSYYIGRTLAEQKGDYDQAIGYLLQAVKAYPRTPEVLYAVGACYHQMGKTEEMKAYWGRLLDIAPRYPEADRIRKLMGEAG
jgi:tetratricopeptide (TPR) repeat protein